MKSRLILAALACAAGLGHAAGIDLAVTITAPNQIAAGLDERIRLEIKNVGTVRSNPATVDLTFSKWVQVLEVLPDNGGPPCQILVGGSGQTIRCTYGGRNPGASFLPAVRVRAPSNIASTIFTYRVTSANDVNPYNDVVTLPVGFSNVVPAVVQPPSDNADITLCSGGAYFDWSQCDNNSYLRYSLVLEAANAQNGMTNTLVYQGNPIGTWSRPAANKLRLVYGDGLTGGAIYVLTAATNNCYRGPAQFVNRPTPWYAQMQACL